GRLVTLTAYTDGTTGPRHTIYGYNDRGLQTSVTYEETGTVTMAYDAVGNMTRRTDEAGVVVDYAYNSASRLTERKKSGSTTDVETYAYDELGRLVTADKGTSSNSDSVSRSIFAYDDLSRVTQESQAIAEGTALVVNYEYDKAGNRIEMIHHGNATTVTYAYDARDRCTQIDNGTVRLADYTWLGTSLHQRDTTCDYPGTTKPKFKTAFDRDGILRVTKVDNEHLTPDMDDAGYNDLGEFDYTYDSASNPLSEIQAGSMDELDADREFDYDTLNRLLTARVTDTQNWTAASEKTTWYSYDDVGNRISHQYRDATAIGYQHDDANRMTSYAGNSQGYDLAGNQTVAYSADRATSYKYSYDHHNRLLAVHDSTGTTRKAAFKYDALGRRIEFANDVTNETIRYYYDGVNEIVEHDTSGNRSRYYIHGVSYVDERLMMYSEEADRPYYYTIDRMYNVRSVVDRGGAIVERYAYDPFGRPLIRQSAGRGDMNNDTDVTGTDTTRYTGAFNGTGWDPRADMNDDGSVNGLDNSPYGTALTTWVEATPAVSQAFSDVGNPFMFQGRPHMAIDTAASVTVGNLMLNDHRARFNDPVIGRWMNKDPLYYNGITSAPLAPSYSAYVVYDGRFQKDNLRYSLLNHALTAYSEARNLNRFLRSNPVASSDPFGLVSIDCDDCDDYLEVTEALQLLNSSLSVTLGKINDAIDNDNGQYPIFTGTKLRKAKETLECMSDNFNGLEIECPSCCFPGFYAYTYPHSNNNVWLCPRFFDNDILDKERGAIIGHEMSHNCGTLDLRLHSGPPGGIFDLAWECNAYTYQWWLDRGFCIPNYDGLGGCDGVY
ncbi:MAG: hypothetical protein MI923_09860, partial [Phycisphaerales bacterium]|nr:hypothetical protein [Phycisphaerales bacterium]